MYQELGKFMEVSSTIEGHFIVANRKRKLILGEIAYNTRWKQFEFCPCENTAYTPECLRDLYKFLVEISTKKAELNAKKNS